MTTPITTSTIDSQMHNSIMTAGSMDHPPMLATGRYAQWRSRFLRYIDTKTNEKSPAVPEHTTVETILNMSPVNKAHFKLEKEAIHMILTGIGDEIYSTVDACNTTHEMWEAIERLQQGESLNIQDVKTNLFWEFGKFTSHNGESIESYYSRFYILMNEMIKNNLTVDKMQVNVQFLQQLQPEWSRLYNCQATTFVDEVSYHMFFDILKTIYIDVNQLCAERIAKNANPLTLVATAQPHQDPYYQTSKSHKSYAPTSRTSLPTRSNETTRHKGKEIAKPITPPFESASDKDNDPEQAQKDKEIQKNLALIVKYFKKLYKPTNNNLRTSSNTRNKNVDTTPRYKNNNQSRQFGNQRTMTIAGARETVRIIKSVDYVILCYLVISLSFVNVNVVCNKKLVNTSRAKKLEKSHDPLALVAHTGSSSRQTSSYYLTHPTSMVDYDDEYQQDDVHNNSEDPLVSAITVKEQAFFTHHRQRYKSMIFVKIKLNQFLGSWMVYLEFFWNLFQMDIKEMKDVFESTKSELDELEKQNDLLKDQLLEASLKQDVELLLGFTMELKIPSSFKTTGLLQPWQTLCKIFSKCLTTRVTGWDQPPITDNANVHCFEDTKQVGYADTSLDESLMKMSKEELSDVAEVFGDRCSSDLFLKSRKQEKCGTWLMSTLASEEIEREPRSNKESLEVEITKDKEVEITKETLVVEITNVVIPVNVNDDDEEITDEVYELKRREKGKLVEETRNSLIPTPIRSPRIHTNLVSLDTEKLQELTNTPHTTSSSSSPHKSYLKRIDFYHCSRQNLLASNATRASFTSYKDVMVTCFYTSMARFIARQSFDTPVIIFRKSGNIQAQISTQIENAIANVIPSQVDASVHNIAIWLALQMKFERNTVPQTACRTLAVRPRDQDDPHDDAHPEGENSAKRQKTSEYEAYVSGESSSGQVFQEEQAPSTSGNQEQDDDFDFWTDSYASDDDEIPTKQVSQDIMEEVSLTIDEAKLRKMADEMLRQRCTSGDEHQYHIDQMKNFLKSDIVWESRKEILVSPHPRKTTPLVHSCQKDPEAPALSLINQDLLYLKKGNSGPEKIVLSLHKFPAVIFNDDDIEERTSRWVNKCVRKFNPYARYGVEHWKNPHAKIFYIRKQKEPGKPKEESYSNSKIVQVIKAYWELGHEHKFITEIVARRANKYLVSITEPDYKNLNKNDIEDIYLLIMNGKVPDYADTGLLWSLSVFIRSTVIWERVHDFQLGIESYQQKVNLTAPTMTFPGIEDHEMFSIIYEPVHGIIYKNSKKEKRVMRHSEIHKFCDATLNRVLEGLKSYNNDIKYGYVQKDLTKDEAEYLKLFEEEIEERLKHRRQMRRWEMFVNGRPLGPRRERPE
ncbi:hypothetical protein Tco_1447382 [Tanacetum coccineum]